jgi:hypothetical protein
MFGIAQRGDGGGKETSSARHILASAQNARNLGECLALLDHLDHPFIFGFEKHILFTAHEKNIVIEFAFH